MKLQKIALGGALMLLAAPLWAGTYYGGFEDTNGGDYDYNDIVFKITGATLNSSGSFFGETAAALLASNDSGSPFWNHTSSDPDTAHDNIGYCVYGDAADSGACGGLAALDPVAAYLAASNGVNSANDITFTSTGGTTGTVLLEITSATDTLGWYNLDTPGTITVLGAGLNSITPDAQGKFGLVGIVNGTTKFYSNDTSATPLGDSVSHFALFETPEPGTMAMLGLGLVTIGFWRNRRKA